MLKKINDTLEDLANKFAQTFTFNSKRNFQSSSNDNFSENDNSQPVIHPDVEMEIDSVQNQCDNLIKLKSFKELMNSSLIKCFKIVTDDDDESNILICNQCKDYLGENSLRKTKFNKNINIGIKINPILFQDEIKLKESELIKQKEFFYTLRNSIKRHFSSPTHLKALESEEQRSKTNQNLDKRQEEVGLKIARLIHNSVFEGRSYYEYERDICILNLMTDIGSQQHSRKFPPKFIQTMSKMIATQLSNLLSTPLPCMGGRPRPVSITADKGTLKGLTLHPIGINTMILSQGYLNSEFYAGAPLLTGWSGQKLAQNILSSISMYGLTAENLPMCITSACFDGEYYIKNVPEHLANELNLPPAAKNNFLQRSIWDAAHRLELVEEHSRSKSPIIKKFEKKIHNQIKYFRVGKQHINLKEEASEMGVKAYEPRQTSDTRFVIHEHRVLCNQFHNWSIQYNFWEKRAQEMNNNKEIKITSQEVTEAQNSAADLRDMEHITLFLAMLELTDLLGRSSCQMQSTNNFPWVFIDEIESLKKKLEYVKQCFTEGNIPEITHESYGPNPKAYCSNNLGKPPWSVMKNNIPSDSRPTFLKIPVVMQGEFDNRPLRRYMTKKVNKEKRTINSEVKRILKKIADTYITLLIKHIDGYFFNGDNPSGVVTEVPLWIKLSKKAFNFKEEISIQKRQESFAQLLTTLVQPLSEKECDVANFQYRMLLSRAENIIRDDGDSPQNLKSIIYRLCTVPELYKGCELSISVMLSNLSCITSECGMESLISTIKDNNSIDRPLSIEQLHHEIMIRKNGPHPLHPATTKFLLDALYRHFGGGSSAWSFIRRSYFHKDEESQVISRHIRDVPPYKLQL